MNSYEFAEFKYQVKIARNELRTRHEQETSARMTLHVLMQFDRRFHSLLALANIRCLRDEPENRYSYRFRAFEIFSLFFSFFFFLISFVLFSSLSVSRFFFIYIFSLTVQKQIKFHFRVIVIQLNRMHHKPNRHERKRRFWHSKHFSVCFYFISEVFLFCVSERETSARIRKSKQLKNTK